MAPERKILTGIKPTGTPHLGNYLGAIRPGLELARTAPSWFFVANLHALTTMRDGDEVRRATYEVAATWLACGLDPETSTLYRQSDIPEVCELAWILSCYTAQGLLERAHAYKAARDRGEAVNAGLYTYPVLMAADILAFRATDVPVGQDQKQHVEIARDIALLFNRTHGDILTIPAPLIQESTAVVPGLDGRKMSKSYDNTISIFADPAQVRKRVMAIKTDSTPVAEPKDPDRDNVFAIYRCLASPEETAEMAERYRRGGTGYGEAKKALAELIVGTFAAGRDRYVHLTTHPDEIEDVFRASAGRARPVAAALLAEIRAAVGI